MDAAAARYPLLAAIARHRDVATTPLDTEIRMIFDEVDTLRAVAGVAQLLVDNAPLEAVDDVCDRHPECLLDRGHDGPCREDGSLL